jgi:hypothetical protein
MRPPLLVMSLCLGGLLLAGCSATVQPPRSPLAEPSATFAPGAGTPLPTAQATPSRPAGEGPPPSALAEPAAARSLALLAEWIAMPARTLRIVVAEAVVWPDACLGIEQPGMMCAQMLTPGFRVLLQDPLGGAHSVHAAGASGDARWAGEMRVRGSISALDLGGGRVMLRTEAGATLVLRLVPGTAWLPAASQTAVIGGRVVAGYDPGGGTAAPIAAWIALDPA